MNYSILHLDTDEHVILEVRKHWIVFFGHALSMFFGALFPWVVYVLIQMFLPDFFMDISLSINTYALVLFLYCLWLLFLWINFFVEWTKYYLDVWYVTEKRIIDIEQKKIFDRQITNLRFDKIQDVTIDVHGFIPTLLHFGNIQVQTAGEDNTDFAMSNVRHPDKVRQIIFSQHNEIGDAPINYAKKTLKAEESENKTG